MSSPSRVGTERGNARSITTLVWLQSLFSCILGQESYNLSGGFTSQLALFQRVEDHCTHL